jgi:hypothetical protein
MEESGTTIREAETEPIPALPKAFLCDANDKPTTEYVGDDNGNFRIKVGRQWYERFHVNAAGDSYYRVVK